MCNAAFHHDRDDIDLAVAVQVRFTAGQETGIRELDKIADALPGPGVALPAEDPRIHHRAVFPQASKSSRGQRIPLQYLRAVLLRVHFGHLRRAIRRPAVCRRAG